ncbi:MAG: beta-galactosidase [Opitutaceae bacterium]|jgi:hypothetical protein
MHPRSRLFPLLCASALGLACGGHARAETIFALTENAHLLQLGTDGKLRAEQTIRTPVDSRHLRDIRLADIDPGHDGRELVVIRDDNHIETYPSPIGSNDDLRRLRFQHLSKAASGGLGAFTVETGVNDSVPKIVTLRRTDNGGTRLMTHAFPPDAGIHLPVIDDLGAASAVRLKGWELAAFDPASAAFVVATKNGEYERCAMPPSPPSSTNITGRFKLAPGDSLQAVALRGERLYAITAQHLLISQTISRTSTPANISQSRLTAGYNIVAMFVDDSPRPDLARQEVTWSRPDASAYQYADVASLISAPFSTANQPPPLFLPDAGKEGLVRGTHITIPAPKTPGLITIPLDLALPDDTEAIAVWLQAPTPGDHTVRFVLGDANGTFVVTEGDPEGVPATPAQWGVRYSTEARFNDWTLRQSYLTGKHRSLTLHRIEIATKQTAGHIVLCGPRIISQATPRSEATLVWKLKDFITPKQSSVNWTATHYYEYGYDRPALLQPLAWLQSLHGKDQAATAALSDSLEILLRAADGTPRQSWTLRGDELANPIALPRAPEGSWFIGLKARNKRDALVAQARLVYQVLRDDRGGTAFAHPEKNGTPSAVPERPFMLTSIIRDGASTQTGSPLQASLVVNPLDGWSDWPLTASWTIHTVDGATVAHETAAITRTTLSIPLRLPAEQPGAYIVTAQLVDASGTRLDQMEETYGVGALPDANSRTVGHRRPPLNYGAVVSISLAGTHHDPDQIKRLPTDTLPELTYWSKTAGMAGGVLQNWQGTVEPIKGCYQWRFFDAEFSQARSQGIDAIWTGIGFAGDNVPEWLWFEELLDQHQQTIHAEYHYVSPFGPRFRDARNQATADLLARYRDDPTLAGVMIYSGPSEGYLTDTGPMIADYSPAALTAFTAYLKNRYNSDLEKLNQHWGSAYRTWTEVAPPLPDWSQPRESSRAWWDFHCFKADWILRDLGGFFARSRAAAPDLPLMSYGKEGFGGTGRLAPVFRQNRIRYTNGGGETLASYVQTSIMRNHGVPANPEGHYVMPNIGSVSMVIANSLFAGQYQGQNIMWGLVWAKTPHAGVPEYAAVARLTSAIDRHSKEMNLTQPIQPWAAYFGSTRAMLESRSFRNPLNNEANLLAGISGGQLHNLCSWVDDGSELAALNRYRLIVDSGAHVLAPESLPILLDYVAAGGTFVATTDTARYLAGNPAEANALLYAQLGAVRIDRSVQADGAGDATQSLSLSRLDKIEWKARLPHPPKALFATTDGQPLVWEVPYGRGRFLILCGAPDWSKSAGWVQNLANTTVGPQPYSIEGERLVARPLRGPDADYVVFVAMMPDRGLNHTAKTLEAATKVRVAIKGLPAELSEAKELITDETHTVSAGVLDFETTPGMVRIIKIPHSTP